MATQDAEEQMRLGDESYVSKLTLKTIGCKPQAVAGQDGDAPLPLARIFGAASDVKTQTQTDVTTGKTESWDFIYGQFESINLQSGEVHRSAKMFLPKGIQEVIELAVEKMKKKREDDKTAPDSISFGMEISSKKATNKAGYSYEAKMLQSPKEFDALQGLRQAIRQLPAVGALLKQKQLQGQGKVR